MDYPQAHPTILITGATGLLGGALAAELLKSGEWSNVLLLVRGEDTDHALQRTKDSLARFISTPQLLDEIKPAHILVGDFTAPAAFVADERLQDIRRVVHCAALTSFGANRRAFSTNVDGTLRFVHHLRQVADIERFLHVSTAMICGDAPPPVVREDDYPLASARHLVSYTESKAEAERLLRLTLPNFPLVIVRPSIIVGHSQLGTAPSSSIFWTFRVADALGMILGQERSQIDVIPVDYAAEVLLQLLLKPKLRYPSYHISAGMESACSWEEIAVAFAQSESWSESADQGSGSPSAVRTNTGYRTVTLEEIEGRKPEFDTLFGRCHKGFMMKAIKLYGAFASLNTVFDTRRIREEGIAASPRFIDYLSTCRATSEPFTISDQMAVDFS